MVQEAWEPLVAARHMVLMLHSIALLQLVEAHSASASFRWKIRSPFCLCDVSRVLATTDDHEPTLNIKFNLIFL